MPCKLTGAYDVKGSFYEISTATDSQAVKPTSGRLVNITKVDKKFYRYEEFADALAPIIATGTKSLENENVLVFTAQTQFGNELIYVKGLKFKKNKAKEIEIKAVTTNTTVQAVTMIGKRRD